MTTAVDDIVEFDGGQKLRRRSFPDAGIVVIEPYLGAIEAGARVGSQDVQCGLGYVLRFDGREGVAVFPTVLGGEVTSAITPSDRRLPTSIDASFLTSSGEWIGHDVTELILGLDHVELISLRDGAIPSFLAGVAAGLGASQVELAAATSFYFGYLPQLTDGVVAVSGEISLNDLMQAQKLRDLATDNAMAPTLG